MDNELRILIRGKSAKTITQIAQESGISRNTITTLIKTNDIGADGFPRKVEVLTLDRLAAACGQRLVITLEPLDRGGEADNDVK